MPEPVPEVDDLDLAASAAIDGVAPQLEETVDGVAAPGSRELEARVARLRPVVDALSNPVQQPDTRIRDDQVRRALSVAEADGAASARSDTGAPSRPARPPVRRWLAAAAAIAVVVVGALALARLASSHGPRAQTASVAGTGTRSTAAPAAGPSEALGGASAAGTSNVDQLPDLGSAADADALVTLVRRHQANDQAAAPSLPTTTVFGSSATPGAGATPPNSACATSVQAAHRDLGPLDLVARASLAGQRVEVLVFRTGSTLTDGLRVLAVRPSDCRVLVDRSA